MNKAELLQAFAENLLKTSKDGIGITNGDIIKTMFPNAEIKFMVNLSEMHSVRVKFGDNTYNCYDDHTFSREWWDAPYMKAVNE